jgi:TPR repeat protein
MFIKSIAHLAHQRITSIPGSSFKRAHFYELMSAAFGYASHAALQADAVVFDGAAPPSPEELASRLTAMRGRARELAYPQEQADDPVPDDVGTDDETRPLPWVNRWPHEDTPDDDALLRGCLRAAADRGSAPAHHALALIHGPGEYDPDGDRSDLKPYWYEQRQAGVELTGVQIEWADAWEQKLKNHQAFEHHLREAARLRHPAAAVDRGRLFRDPAVFDSGLDLTDEDPLELAEIAESLKRPADAKRWLTVAAEAGDTGAMRALIEGHDAGDPHACWKWMHLATLHGEDLAQDHYRAINEDGSDHDDDVGGPAYLGGYGGVELEELPPRRGRPRASSGARTLRQGTRARARRPQRRLKVPMRGRAAESRPPA